MGKRIICTCGYPVELTSERSIPWHLISQEIACHTPCPEVGRCDPAIRLNVSVEERAERKRRAGSSAPLTTRTPDARPAGSSTSTAP